MTHIRMTQTYKGLPVVGGELIVHLTEDKVAGINGRFVADLDLPTQPTITPDQATAQALAFVKDHGGLNARVSEDPHRKRLGLAKRVNRAKSDLVIVVKEKNIGRLALTIQVEYEGPDGIEIDELFVDAENGQILDRHPLIWRAKYRQIYDAKNKDYDSLPGIWQFNEGGSSSDTAAMCAYKGTGTTYDFYS